MHPLRAVLTETAPIAKSSNPAEADQISASAAKLFEQIREAVTL